MNPNLPDDDEPIVEGLRRPTTPTAPRPAAQPPPTPAKDPTAASTTAPDDEWSWGSVGIRHSWGLLSGDTGEEGVIRITEPGVTYSPPPTETGLRRWRQTSGNPQRFEMPWNSKPHGVRSLEQLGHDLGQKPPTRADDPRLTDLDTAVVRLLHLTEQLHQHSSRLGLVHPRNVLLVPTSSGWELVLPDHGFLWKGGPFRPTWIADETFRPLWDRGPETQQDVTATDDGSAAADVRTLARLFACVLTGVAVRDVPERPPAASRPQTQNAAALAGVWTTLSRASAGSITTVSELASALKESPLSRHVFALPPPPPPPPPPKGKPVAATPSSVPTRKPPYGLAAVGGVVLLGLLAALLLWKPWRAGVPDSTIRETLPETSTFAELLERYAAAAPEEQAALLRRLYNDSVLSSDSDQRQQQQAERERLRREFLHGNWLRRYREAEQLGEELPQRFAAGKQFQHLRDELQLLQERPSADQALDAEEKQCLTFSGMRVVELGSAP